MAAATWLLYPLLARVAPFVARDTGLLYSAFRAPSPAVVSLALAPIVGEQERPGVLREARIIVRSIADGVEEDLRRRLGTKVTLARSRKGGRIIIEFYSDEELAQLYDRLIGGPA